MRKVVLSIMLSLDGYIEGPGQDINWHVWNDEMNRYMGKFFERVDTILFGRKTYELMLSYWPTAANEDPVITERMNNLPKVVFSKSLDTVEWNATLVKDNVKERITKMKQAPGKDMVIFGGASLASSFMSMNLVDEYKLIINPVILGSGKPLFNIQNRLNLNLIRTESFNCGNVVLHYEPGGDEK